jgi:hypothetical protein
MKPSSARERALLSSSFNGKFCPYRKAREGQILDSANALKGSKALLRLLNRQRFDSAFHAGWRPRSLRVYFGGFLAALAASGYVCYSLRSVIPRFFLVGHDWGGPTGFALAARHRQAVRRIAIFDVPVPGDGTPVMFNNRWHHGLHWELDLPEALTAGREELGAQVLPPVLLGDRIGPRPPVAIEEAEIDTGSPAPCARA